MAREWKEEGREFDRQQHEMRHCCLCHQSKLLSDRRRIDSPFDTFSLLFPFFRRSVWSRDEHLLLIVHTGCHNCQSISRVRFLWREPMQAFTMQCLLVLQRVLVWSVRRNPPLCSRYLAPLLHRWGDVFMALPPFAGLWPALHSVGVSASATYLLGGGERTRGDLSEQRLYQTPVAQCTSEYSLSKARASVVRQ